MDSLLHDNWHNRVQSIVSNVGTALTPIIEHNFNFGFFEEDVERTEERAKAHSIPMPEPDECAKAETQENKGNIGSNSPIPPPNVITPIRKVGQNNAQVKLNKLTILTKRLVFKIRFLRE